MIHLTRADLSCSENKMDSGSSELERSSQPPIRTSPSQDFNNIDFCRRDQCMELYFVKGSCAFMSLPKYNFFSGVALVAGGISFRSVAETQNASV
jgi:hypothetical protein